MNIQKLIISAGLAVSTFCLQGMKDDLVLTKEQQMLFDKWNIDNKGKYRSKIQFQFQDVRVLNAFKTQLDLHAEKGEGSWKEKNGIIEECKEILSILLKNRNQEGFWFIRDFLLEDHSLYFKNKNISLQEFMSDSMVEDLRKITIFSEGRTFTTKAKMLRRTLTEDAQLLHDFIYHYDFFPVTNCNLFFWIKKRLKSDGFRVGGKVYNTKHKIFSQKHILPQTPESRVEYFKAMLKPSMSQKMNKEVAQKNLTFMLCLNDLVKNKKLSSKVPNPVLLNLIIRPSDRFSMACDTIKKRVSEYKKELGDKPHDKVDQFLCNEFDGWYAQELKQCMKI